MSSLRDVKGIGAATTLNPLACKGRMTPLQLEPSAHAPWTMTMVIASRVFMGKIIIGAVAAFLPRLAEFYALLADLRNCRGVRPTARLKYVQSLL